MESKIDSLKMVSDAAKHDYHSRNDEHNIKLLDESYDFGWNEKDNLLTKYNYHMFDLIQRIYSNEYDDGSESSWRTNETVSIAQNFLNEIGYSNIKEDGYFGTDTQNALKDYVYEFSGKHMWEDMKSGAEEIWEPDNVEDPPFYDWK